MEKAIIDRPVYCEALKDLGFSFEYSKENRIVEARFNVKTPLGNESHGLGLIAIAQEISDSNAADIGEFIVASLNTKMEEIKEVRQAIADLDYVFSRLKWNFSPASHTMPMLGSSVALTYLDDYGNYKDKGVKQFLGEVLDGLKRFHDKLTKNQGEEAAS